MLRYIRERWLGAEQVYDQAQTTLLLGSILRRVWVATMIATPVFLLVQPDPRYLLTALGVNAGVMLGLPLLTWLMQRRRAEPLLWALLLGALLYFGILVGPDITASGISYCLVVVMAGLLLGPRGALVFGILSSLAVVLKAAGLQWGWHEQSATARLEAWGDAAISVMGVIVAAGLIRLVMRHLHDAVHRARQDEQLLAGKNAELSRSNDTLRAVIDSSPAAIFAVDAAGRLTLWNPAAERMFGWQAGEACGRSTELLLPSGARLVDSPLRPEAGAVEQTEARLRRKDNAVLEVALSLARIERDGPERIAVAVDMTERHAMEAALRQSEERYRRFIETTFDGIWVLDAQHNTSFANAQMAAMLGCTVREMQGASIYTFVNEADHRLIALHIEQWRQGVVGRYDIKLSRRDGFGVWALVSASPFFTPEGQYAGVIAVVSDITERKLAEEHLRHSEALLAASQRLAHVGSWRWELASQVMHWSDQQYSNLGLHPNEIVPGYRALLERVHPEDREALTSLIEQVTHTGRRAVSEFRAVWPNGEVRYLQAALEGVLNEHGRPIEIIGTAQDITERKQAELAQQATQAKLQSWVNELEERNAEIRQLTHMSELLQSSANSAEAFEIIGCTWQQLFPGEAGVLYMLNPAQNIVEPVVHWGRAPGEYTSFEIEACWAMRRVRPHLSRAGRGEPRCRHVRADDETTHLCLPIMAHGEIIGSLHLSSERPEHSTFFLSEARRQMAQTAADNIGLALANLRLRENLRNQSIHDPLTGLYNRRYMEECLERELLRALRSNQFVSIILIDLDHFKRLNDTYGHAAGDMVLSAMGAVLHEGIRGSDIACRYGGEEFALILPNASLEVSRQRAEGLRQRMQQLTLYHADQLIGEITISAGVAAFPTHGHTTEELLRAADQVLYVAKRTGRNRVATAPEKSPVWPRLESSNGHARKKTMPLSPR